MRRLGQPEVLRSAAIGALATMALCFPRLSMWTDRPGLLWYSEAVVFFTSVVLWAFVFAWHTEYTQRPVITFNWSPRLFAGTTLAGILGAIGLHFFLDPVRRPMAPEEYPTTLDQWVAEILFTLSFTQLFLVFAPFAWSMRLFRSRSVAIVLTVVLGVFVLILKSRSAATPVPLGLFASLLGIRIVAGLLTVWVYWRGGVVLVWWLGLLVESRHLFSLNPA